MNRTQVIKDIWKQKRYRTWDDAFRGLTPVMRQQSVRVAEYTQVLFEGVCKSSFYTRNRETPIYMDESYTEIAYKCGFYHQVGKAMDPEKYSDWREDFTEEEKKAYCEYTIEGKELVAKLQGESGEDISIPSRMIQEACEQHMERWDGDGFPYGYFKEEISLIAQIVGLAKEFDRLLCERKSENLYEEAIESILAESYKKFSPNLIDVFRSCQPELKNIFKKYIQYTKIMPKTVPLVDKRPERPFGLNYRQIISGKEMESWYYEAVPWFGGVLNKPEARETAVEAEELLLRTGLTADITIYFLYEAADLVARMKNCQLYTGGVMVPVFSAFYSGESQAERLAQLFEDTAIDKKKLLLLVQESLLRTDRSVQERLSEYISQGVTLVLDDYHPEDVPLTLIREIGFTYVRIAKDSRARSGTHETMQEFKSHGITVIDWPAGDTYLSEDELIKYLFSHE